VDVHRLPPGHVVVVRVAGDLVAQAAPTIPRAVGDELRRSPGQLVVDLSLVTRVDREGVDALALCAQLAGESDISFCLAVVDGGPVLGALEEAELTELFEVFGSVDEATDGRR
jgi:anti-anti-sigma regulatory factor